MASYRAFGIALETNLRMDGLKPAAGEESAVLVERTSPRDLESAWSGRLGAPVWDTRFPDGAQVRVELGVAGDQRITYGDQARFLISTAHDRVLCAARDDEDPAWRRFLLDTVLWWLCLARGMEVVHAGSVETSAGVLAFASGTGGGKTSLCAELLRRGNRLFADDVLALERRDDGLLAHPGPGLMNLPLAAGDPEDLGRPLAMFPAQEESWVAVDRVCEDARPIAAIFILRRAPGLRLDVKRRAATALDLLPHAWGLPQVQDRELRGFHLASDLVQSVPIYDLHADLSSRAGTLADLVESTFDYVDSREKAGTF